MSGVDLWPWFALGLLGIYHGINPAMGWLFAVALGLQERSRGAVVRALIPIALGHEASIALAAALVDGFALVTTPGRLRLAGAAALVLFGLYKFLRPRSHPRWVGMRVTGRDLVIWSFLMSTAHGAGLMLFPVLLGMPAHHHAHEASEFVLSTSTLFQDAAAVSVHSLAMLATMGAVAILVYEKFGIGLLRRAWVNLDLVWAVAVATAGVATLLT